MDGRRPIFKYILGTSMDGLEDMRTILDEAAQTKFALLFSYTTAGRQAYCNACNQ